MLTTGSNIQLNRTRSGSTVSMISSNIVIPFETLTGTTTISSTNNRVQEGDIIQVFIESVNPLSRGAFCTLQFEN
jgi:hypothetical protein